MEEVNEVIPDPVYIHPLGEDKVVEKKEDKVYEKADITSPVDEKIKDQLDEADTHIKQVGLFK